MIGLGGIFRTTPCLRFRGAVRLDFALSSHGVFRRPRSQRKRRRIQEAMGKAKWKWVNEAEPPIPRWGCWYLAAFFFVASLIGPLFAYMAWESGPARWIDIWARQPSSDKLVQAAVVMVAAVTLAFLVIWVRRELASLKEDSGKGP